MATERAVARMMKIFSRNFAGEVTKDRCKLYHAALQDVSDEQLDAATARVIREHESEFIPPVAIIRKFAAANARPILDVEATIIAISRYGASPPARWYPPRPDALRAYFPEGVVRAYAEVGGTVLFSDNATTREIAYRDFAKVYRETVRDDPRLGITPALPAAVAAPARLPAGEEPDPTVEEEEAPYFPDADGDPTARL
jgi:hypothetical protein